jgi:hypothetical protein
MPLGVRPSPLSRLHSLAESILTPKRPAFPCSIRTFPVWFRAGRPVTLVPKTLFQRSIVC